MKFIENIPLHCLQILPRLRGSHAGCKSEAPVFAAGPQQQGHLNGCSGSWRHQQTAGQEMAGDHVPSHRERGFVRVVRHLREAHGMGKLVALRC